MINCVWCNSKRYFLRGFIYLREKQSDMAETIINNMTEVQKKTKEYIEKLNGIRMFKCVNVKKYYKQN